MKRLDKIDDKFNEYIGFRPEYNLDDSTYRLDLLNILYLVKDFCDDEIVSCLFSRPNKGNYFTVNGLASSFPINKAFNGRILYYDGYIIIDLTITKLFNNREYVSLTRIDINNNILKRTTLDNYKCIDYIDNCLISNKILKLTKKIN